MKSSMVYLTNFDSTYIRCNYNGYEVHFEIFHKYPEYGVEVIYSIFNGKEEIASDMGLFIDNNISIDSNVDIKI